MQIVLGTHNKKKLFELDLLLGPLGFTLKTLADFPEAIEVEETGTTFAENARLKATVQAKHLHQWVLGEDSGLSVDALDGKPGVYSARFAGPDATDEDNNEKLLQELEGVPFAERTAHYTSHITLSDPTGQVMIECEDYCHGIIDTKLSGSGGFGYDPMFIIPEYDLTFGQLGNDIKSILSHRARAMRRFIPELLSIQARHADE